MEKKQSEQQASSEVEVVREQCEDMYISLISA